ncbi:MAG TPA: hypothetical protein VEG34_16700 [Thermoanaerobaculia bacterium]|nr:hypothetical protein [Thermoanaerobaculia bacterium]
MADSQASLVEQALSGANPQLQRLAAEGLLPLPPEQLIPLQVALTRHADRVLAGRAAETLRGADPRLLAPFLTETASEEVLGFFARHLTHPVILEAILRRRDVPRALLAELAGRLSPDLQEMLLLRQDAIIEAPEILSALEENPELSPYSQRRILEYREHLLPRDRPVRAAWNDSEDFDEFDEAAFLAALHTVKQQPAEGELEETSGLSEGQIRLLPIPARLRLSRGASRQMRGILVRDQNARVALSVVQNNALSEQEVEGIARNRSVVDDILLYIAGRREWNSKQPIVRALVQNPRTPVVASLRLVPKLAVRDLRFIAKDRNVADAVRAMAVRLYRIKRQ